MNAKRLIAVSITVFVLICHSHNIFANEGGGHGGEGGVSDSLALEILTINLKDGHYIQFKPLLKLVNVADAEMVRASIPIVRWELIKFMIGREKGEVSSLNFMRGFSDDATDLLNKALRDNYIKDVLFDTWLVQ